ncbi:MAG TPA: SUMF1/EgtB/PvdO family nonheme iron enzyme, partial [Mucilaginibacter sp.]|nr:SUMF1/EgtB/PvdO family nonheme iron enzyme [Mucilaginibacter sp.]
MRNSFLVWAGIIQLFCGALLSCRQKPAAVVVITEPIASAKKALCCESNIPKRFASLTTKIINLPEAVNNKSHKGMIWINPGTFMMGADNKQASPDEYPKHKVNISGFWMDATEVTNAEFAQFVKATGYITTAERKPDWNELKKQLPPGTEKPADSDLVAASLVFKAPKQAVELNDYSQWW